MASLHRLFRLKVYLDVYTDVFPHLQLVKPCPLRNAGYSGKTLFLCLQINFSSSACRAEHFKDV